MKVAVSGMGAVHAFGWGVESLWQAAKAERSSIVDGLGRVNADTLSHVRREINIGEKDNAALAMSLGAIHEAMAQAKWAKLEPTDGLILATTTGQIPLWDHLLLESLKTADHEKFAAFAANQPLGALLDKIKIHLNFTGPSLLITSACSAATQAFGVAHQWLKSGRVNRVLVGGTEVLCDLTVQGFSSLQLLSKTTCKPFDSARAGINLSEASAFLCLEARGAHSLAELSGFGISLDGYHPTAPHPEGHGTLRAAQQALAIAGVRASDISWIHAHGTGSQHNDFAEGQAFSQLETAAPVSSTKAIHGHALGAVGALESLLIVRALQEQFILRTAGLTEPDPKIPMRHVRAGAKTTLRHVLKNTAGFGGSNAALVFSHV